MCSLLGKRNDSTQGISPSDLEPLFAQLLAAVVHHAPADQQAAAVQQVRRSKAEVAKGKQAEDGHIATIVNGLAGMVPKAVGTIVSSFATPILDGIAGPLTKLVLDQLKGNGASEHGIDTD